jgi:hypothetical protein
MKARLFAGFFGGNVSRETFRSRANNQLIGYRLIVTRIGRVSGWGFLKKAGFCWGIRG